MADIDGYLKQIKSAESGETVRDAIANCLRDINRDVPMVEEDWEGYMPDTTDLTLSGHYKSVHVMHNPSSGKTTKLTTLHVTENDTYEPEDENEYYNKVVVEVDQSPYTIKEEAVEITENGTYYAKEDFGVNGLAEIHVNVYAAVGDGPFLVEFYDKVQTDPSAKVIQTVSVPGGGTAQFDPVDGYPVSPMGQSFVGWNPSPINVTRNMKCYPNFRQKTITVGEIEDGWDIICANKGEPYPLGSYKSLSYGAQITKKEIIKSFEPYTCLASAIRDPEIDEDDYIGMTFDFLCIKVAEGEDGTKSTWITSPMAVRNPEKNGTVQYGTEYHNLKGIINLAQGNGLALLDYRSYGGRGFLNGPFFAHMSDMFKNAIKPVTKYTQYTMRSSAPWEVDATQEAIWVPSVKEIIPTDVTISIDGGEDKFVNSIPQAIAYFRDSLPLTYAEFRHLVCFDQDFRFHMRDVPTTTDGPNGGWRTPVMNMNGTDKIIYEGSSNGGGYNSYVCSWGVTDMQILGFCMG